MILRRVAEFDNVIQKTADNEYIVKVREQQADIPVCTLTISGSPTESSSARQHATQHDRSNEATH